MKPSGQFTINNSSFQIKEDFKNQLANYSGYAPYSNRTKAKVIYDLKGRYSVRDLIRIADIPRSTYYYWEKQLQRPDKYSEAKEKILQVAGKHKGPLAYRRVTEELLTFGIRHDPKTILKLMRELQLC
ncbi:hypothetical protein ABER02_22530 [Rossellomorea marisflavi]|uniref:hypothetical protein n=1 Tax=Rossellomorea marisflavi TaxID=189381 RepID=UPI003D26700B